MELGGSRAEGSYQTIEDKADLPIKSDTNPIPFWYPSEWLQAMDKYKREEIPRDAPVEAKNLRLRSQRLLLQTWHAAVFGYAYSMASGFHTLKVQPETIEYSDRDATFSV